MRVQDLLDVGYGKPLLGRKRELALLQELLHMERDWRLIHVHGPGGIGKSTLLYLLTQALGKDRCLLFDIHNGYRKPADWLRSLSFMLDQMIIPHEAVDLSGVPRNPELMDDPDASAMADRLNQAAENAGGLVLLFDTFEQWGHLEEWLRTEWLPLLKPYVRVCTAGRVPLDGLWERGGWGRLVRNVRLHPLSASDMDGYVRSIGFTDDTVLEKLRKFTGGIPLALSIAIEIMNRKDKPEFLDAAEQVHTIGVLIGELLKDMKDTEFQRYLEAASVLWRFNQEWLQFMLNEPIPDTMFREFCRLPFIISFEGGWGLHDSVRNWTRLDFQRRKPQALEAYRLKALTLLQEREQAGPGDITNYAIDRLYLHESDVVRYYCFSGEVEGHSFRNVKEEDFKRIEELYLAFAVQRNVANAEDPVFAPLFRPLWRAEPSAFIGLWNQGRLDAFYTFTPLNDNTVPLLREHPVTAPYLAGSKSAPKEYIVFSAGMEPHTLEEVRGSMIQHMVHQLSRADLVLWLTPYSEWYPILASIGFEPLPWADSRSNREVIFKAFLLDLRTEDFAAKLDRIFAGQRPPTPDPIVPPSPEEAYPIAKKLLQHYKSLSTQSELIENIGGYLKGYDPLQNQRERIQLIRMLVEQALHTLENGSSDDIVYAKLIKLAYLKKIGTHETVAERMNIPTATYYRQLKKATYRLSELLF